MKTSFYSHFHLILIVANTQSIFLIFIIFVYFQIKETSCNCQRDIGAGISTLISVSDELCPSILSIRGKICPSDRMEGRRPSREKWIKSCLCFARVGISALILIQESTFPYLFLDLVCKQICFPSKKRYIYEI